MRRLRDMHRGRTLLLAAALAAAALVSATPAAAAPQKVTSTCWNAVVNDWLLHQPNVDGTYPIGCYTQAIQHLNGYPDVQSYSSAIEDIRRAMLFALHHDSGSGFGDGGGSNGGLGGGGTGGGGSGGSGSGGGGSGGGTAASANSSPIHWLSTKLSPDSAQSVPLPLLVLGALALLLLLAAAATWIARRLQARKLPPRPAPAPAPAPRRR